MTTAELDQIAEKFIRSHEGATPAFKGLYGFPGSICTSINNEIVHGIPQNENVNVVREDPHRRGLLFAGTERAVYVSFDDG